MRATPRCPCGNRSSPRPSKNCRRRVEELGALQKKLQDLEAARQQREEAGWQGLVKLYETMKPRDAAVIFNDLQMPCCCRSSIA